MFVGMFDPESIWQTDAGFGVYLYRNEIKYQGYYGKHYPYGVNLDGPVPPEEEMTLTTFGDPFVADTSDLLDECMKLCQALPSYTCCNLNFKGSITCNSSDGKSAVGLKWTGKDISSINLASTTQ